MKKEMISLLMIQIFDLISRKLQLPALNVNWLYGP